MTLETLTATKSRLHEAGYGQDLVALPGHMHAVESGFDFDPRDLVPIEIVRCTNSPDSDDGTLLVVLETVDSRPLGTFAVPFGPSISADEVSALRHLHFDAESVQTGAAPGGHDHSAALFERRPKAEAAAIGPSEHGMGLLRNRVLRGIAIGFVVLTIVGFVLATVAGSEIDFVGRVGIGLFVGFWGGPFFGGTVVMANRQLMIEREGSTAHLPVVDLEQS